MYQRAAIVPIAVGNKHICLLQRLAEVSGSALTVARDGVAVVALAQFGLSSVKRWSRFRTITALLSGTAVEEKNSIGTARARCRFLDHPVPCFSRVLSLLVVNVSNYGSTLRIIFSRTHNPCFGNSISGALIGIFKTFCHDKEGNEKKILRWFFNPIMQNFSAAA